MKILLVLALPALVAGCATEDIIGTLDVAAEFLGDVRQTSAEICERFDGENKVLIDALAAAADNERAELTKAIEILREERRDLLCPDSE